MGTKSKAIVNMNVEELIEQLNKALADEWLAYYQYWVGALVVKGPNRPAVAAELQEHAVEELMHANMLAARILQLGGVPILDPAEFGKFANCKYSKPVDFAATAILKQNIAGEQCAIALYDKLLQLTKNKDDITYNMLLSILKDEIEHEDDLQNILEDIQSI